MNKRSALIFSVLALLAVASCRREEVPGPAVVPSGEDVDPGREAAEEDPAQEPSDDPSDHHSDDTEDKTRTRSGEIPKVYITTASSIWSKDIYVPGSMRLVDSDGWYSDLKDTTMAIQIKGRGQSTWGNPKKPYRIKLEGKAKVLGMKKNRDWDIIANYNDKSQMRNKLGMKVSKIMDLPWTPKHRTCELYLNGAYKGTCDVFQHKEVAGEKVDINPIVPMMSPDAGDFYLEVESNEADFRTKTPGFQIPIKFKDPEKAELSDSQIQYIKDWMASMEAALVALDFTSTTGYKKYLDIDSFARFYIVEEIAKNIDGNLRKSAFMTKEAGKPLILYHVWDFDLAFGNCDYMHTEFLPASEGIYGDDPEGFFVKDVNERPSGGKGLMQYLFMDPEFVDTVKNLWTEAYPELLGLVDFLREEDEVYRPFYEANFDRWYGSNPGAYYWPEPWPPCLTYDEAFSRMASFYERRIAWLDSAIPAL